MQILSKFPAACACVALVAGLAAWDGARTRASQSSDASPGSPVVAECSYSLPDGSSDLAVRRAVNAVLDGSRDPCGGALPDRDGFRAELLRISRETPGRIMLVFRLRWFYDP